MTIDSTISRPSPPLPDGLPRRPVSKNWDWLIHPVLPVGRHHGGEFFAYFWMFGQPVVLLAGTTTVHTASCLQVGKGFLRRLDFARSITNILAECRLDNLSYCVCTRGVGVRWRSTDRMAASGHPIDQKTGDPGISQEILTQTGTTATLGVPTSWPVGPAGARYDRIRSAERQGADNRLYAVSSAIAGGRPS